MEYYTALIKTVRVQLREIESLLVDPALGLRVVFLVRDPRGTYNSRSSGTISKWCVKDECANPAVGCDLMHDNIKVGFLLDITNIFIKSSNIFIKSSNIFIK